MFLSEEQIICLTGLRQHAAQIRWLTKNRIRHFVNAAGAPVVPASSIEPPKQEERKRPNFDALKRAG